MFIRQFPKGKLNADGYIEYNTAELYKLSSTDFDRFILSYKYLKFTQVNLLTLDEEDYFRESSKFLIELKNNRSFYELTTLYAVPNTKNNVIDIHKQIYKKLRDIL